MITPKDILLAKLLPRLTKDEVYERFIKDRHMQSNGGYVDALPELIDDFLEQGYAVRDPNQDDTLLFIYLPRPERLSKSIYEIGYLLPLTEYRKLYEPSLMESQQVRDTAAVVGSLLLIVGVCVTIYFSDLWPVVKRLVTTTKIF